MGTVCGEPALGTVHLGTAGVVRLADARKRVLDVALAGLLLVALAPLIVLLAGLIKLDSPGPVFYRCRRVGRWGESFDMLKFRKMRDDAAGLPLTHAGDDRFTTAGRLLALLKLDELPQLWNVVRGDMSLVGPRPEDPRFVAMDEYAFEQVLSVRPGITGLAQLAFARESDLLAGADPIGYYVSRLLPAKLALDRLYCMQWSIAVDLRILGWTILATCCRRPIAVHRGTGTMRVRRRPVFDPAAEIATAGVPGDVGT